MTTNYKSHQFQALLDESASLSESGHFEKAVKCLKKAIVQKTDIFALGIAGLNAAFEKKMQALSEFAKIVCLSKSLEIQLDFIHTIRDFHLFRWDEQIENALLFCLESQSIDPQNVCFPAIQLLKHKQLAQSDPLLLELMRNCVLPDESIEKYLTNLRREALLHYDRLSLEPAFLDAMATQCSINEYVFFVSDLENETIHLAPQKAHRVLNCYQASHKDTDLESDKTIPCVSFIHNSVSQKVRLQYEEHPYPTWLRVDRVEALSLERLLNYMFPFLEKKASKNPKILVAGCGTGKQAVEAALRYKDCQVTAVDLSLTALSYAKKKANETGLSNIQFMQGDILELEGLGKTFDVIECSGVLHHMEQPVDGLKSLIHLLDKNGVMFLGLYSELARRNVALARAFVKRNDYASTVEGIRGCRQAIFDLPPDDPIRSVVNWADFYTMSSCRDLLFHVHEVNFNLLEVKKILELLNLNFLGFDLPKDSIKSQYLVKFPKDIHLRSLENWHEFEMEHPDTFSMMYQFWVSLS